MKLSKLFKELESAVFSIATLAAIYFICGHAIAFIIASIQVSLSYM